MKNRSKFSALRPHYERGRKERMVGGETKQTGCGVQQPLPAHLAERVISTQQWQKRKRCRTCMSFVSHQVTLLHEIARDRQGPLAAPRQGIAGSNEMGVQSLAAFPFLHAVLHRLAPCHTHAVSLLKTVMVPGLTRHTTMLRPSSCTGSTLCCRDASPCSCLRRRFPLPVQPLSYGTAACRLRCWRCPLLPHPCPCPAWRGAANVAQWTPCSQHHPGLPQGHCIAEAKDLSVHLHLQQSGRSGADDVPEILFNFLSNHNKGPVTSCATII